MFSYISGEVIHSDGKKALIKLTTGLGYEVNYHYVLGVGDNAEIYLYHHITEKDQSLWGFKSMRQKQVFELLISVNGVGASKAYPLITQVGELEVVEAILTDNPDALAKAQGVGKKLAEKIILGLKYKLPKVDFVQEQQAFRSGTENSTSLGFGKTSGSKVFEEAKLVLESLGYPEKTILPLMASKRSESFSDSQDLVKELLKEI